jgi:PQQ enzyme repeat
LMIRRQETDIWERRVVVPKAPDSAVYTVGAVKTKTRLRKISQKNNEKIPLETWAKAIEYFLPKRIVPPGTPTQLQPGIPVSLTLPESSLVAYGKDTLSPTYLVREEVQGDNQGVFTYCLDFSKWQRNGKLTPIIYAHQEHHSDIVYVSTGINGYSNDIGGKTGYLSAINTKTGKVIWHAGPLVANAFSFTVLEEVIVCGYGFTKEPDFLYVIDKKTGRTVQKIALKSAAEFIAVEPSEGITGDRVFVRCYDTDYVFNQR